ncbi:MAG: polysaccharide biosynthesis/export family protein [Chlamydiae bacterium]|nr:polysaccharide biosynthesis/export family protein [Chlamydiota bacterium]MBI3276185.1 polysaccharide biosynthesis/export family protein [Chlamydiota bacterium]
MLRTQRVGFFLFIFFLFLFKPSFSQATNDYLVGIDDVLEVSVYDEPDLSLTARVSQSGRIDYPLLGNVKVKGLNVSQVQRLLKEQLEKDYLINPIVTVSVKEFGSIYLLGEVQKPGPYKLSTKTTLMQAIYMAGGTTSLADRSKISIVRVEGEEKKIFHVDLTEVSDETLSGENFKEKDIDLLPNDIVKIPTTRLGKINILGEVSRPGQYDFMNGLTVVDAITLAGGFSKVASPNGTRVIRTEGGVKKVIKVPVQKILKSGDKKKDVQLKPGDIITIPESFL